MNVMVINSGSSSIKYQLFDMTRRLVLAAGLLERIGESQSRLQHRGRMEKPGAGEITLEQKVADHREGFRLIASVLSNSGAVRNPGELFGIGHRVVHGGEKFREPARITPEVVDTIRRLIPLAPLHNPANLLGIEVTLEAAPQVPQVAVFDTAFHQSLPPHAFRYALPRQLYQKHRIRRYGFHGTSHAYILRRAAAYLKQSPGALNLITLHLGNGASITAVKGGRSVDTSMGMTPLEGLIMGSRCGDIDPAIIFYLLRETGRSPQAVEALLNRQSGLKGICGANDMREIQRLAREANAPARLAIDMYCYRIKKYIGAYSAVLGKVNALVFTAGIGENAADIRARCCRDMSHLGIAINEARNRKPAAGIREIQSASARVKILVIPTDEELEIAQQTVKCIRAGS